MQVAVHPTIIGTCVRLRRFVSLRPTVQLPFPPENSSAGETLFSARNQWLLLTSFTLGARSYHREMEPYVAFLSRRFYLALQFASALHYRDHRKGTTIPYIAHR
jgi:hypothetical protein